MTRTVSESFTLTHAKYLASKVTADMRRCQQNYFRPSDDQINNFGTELALLLRDGYVSEYEFGFSQNDQRILSWHYTVKNSEVSAADDRPGRIVSGIEIANAVFFNQLTYSLAWALLSKEERGRVERELPIQRTIGAGPRDGAGYWANDLSYSSTGVALSRRTFRPSLS